MVRHAVALGAFSLLACSGCNDGRTLAASPAGSASPPPAGPSPGAASTDGAAGETVVRVEDDGKSFDVARGASVTFRLAASSGTGYVWTPTKIDLDGGAVLAQQGERSSEAVSDVPGGPRTDVYRFTASAAGSAVVEMSLRRPFGDAQAARAIHVTIHVR
jgi:predicted secreted protein